MQTLELKKKKSTRMHTRSINSINILKSISNEYYIRAGAIIWQKDRSTAVFRITFAAVTLALVNSFVQLKIR